jgi:hypothetical protein
MANNCTLENIAGRIMIRSSLTLEPITYLVLIAKLAKIGLVKVDVSQYCSYV